MGLELKPFKGLEGFEFFEEEIFLPEGDLDFVIDLIGRRDPSSNLRIEILDLLEGGPASFGDMGEIG